jgi:uncharacterized membrane protein YqjE
MDESPQTGGGMFATFTRILRTLGDVAENRVDIFVTEWREERLQFLDVLMLLLAGTVCTVMALLVITFAVVVFFWDTHPFLVLGLIILAYGGAAGVSFWALHRRLRRWQSFPETQEQFKKDLACFKIKN